MISELSGILILGPGSIRERKATMYSPPPRVPLPPMEGSRSNQLDAKCNGKDFIGIKCIAVGAEGDYCHQNESTKAEIPAGAKNRYNLIGGPFRSETNIVWPLLATTGPPALSCSLFPTRHIEPDLQRAYYCRHKVSEPVATHQSTYHLYSDPERESAASPMVRSRARQSLPTCSYF